MVEDTDTPEENQETPEEEYVTPEPRVCVFTVGGREFSVEMEYLKGVAELSEVIPLPLSPSYVEGITSLRGTAVPVVNLAVLKEIPEDRASERWLVVLEVEKALLGITVNEMPDLSADYKGEFIDVPEFFETYRVR
ncbi:MAG: hypothetical protein GXO94_06905 [Nitrospirae bacterium]|nr:hypothetical protein [Nitrospirota bacterium]